MPKILGKTHQVLTKSHGHRPSSISSTPRGSFSHPPDAVRGTPACCYTSWRVATGGKAMGSVCHGGCRGDSPIVMVITRQHGWTWPVVFDDPGWFTYCKWWANYDITRWYTPHDYGNVNSEGPLKPWHFPFQRNSRGWDAQPKILIWYNLSSGFFFVPGLMEFSRGIYI